MSSVNIATHLAAMAATRPDAIAIRVQGRDKRFLEYSYRTLDEACNRTALVLQESGVGKGTRVVVMLRPGLEFFAVVFALFRIGAILVAIDPGIGLTHLKRCIAEAGPHVFIGNLKAQVARCLLGWGRVTIRQSWLTGSTLPLPGIRGLARHIRRATGSPTPVATGDRDTAAILFTSGSTGAPKGVVYQQLNFDAQIRSLRDTYAITPGEIDVATFPLFGLYAPALGMTAVIPDMDFTRPGEVDPARLIAAIEDSAATTMFGSPALLERVGRYGEKQGIRLHTLRRVLSAGAPVAPANLERFRRLLGEDAEIYTPYGATESLPVSSIGSREVLGETRVATDQGLGICVGRPVQGIEVAIIAITDAAIPQWHEDLRLPVGEYGEIVVNGPQVTLAYDNRPEANRLAKILSGDGRFWHRMGDTGYLDPQGRLWFCGRKSHCVMADGIRYFSICCEGVFNVHPAVRRTALIPVQRGDRTVPALCVELLEGTQHTAAERLRTELIALGDRHAHTRAIREFFMHPGFPVDIRHNAKINREALAVWAAGRQQ